ncbi:MAG: GNAT family N-acetyltransferase [Isosphaeraceae bacterium]
MQADFRGQGVFKALYRHIYDQALASSNVISLRLYVENSNLRAQQTYQALGMKPGGYSVLEELRLQLQRRLNCHDQSGLRR